MKTLPHRPLLLLFVVLFNFSNAQISPLNGHNFYYQKVVARAGELNAVATRIFDSLQVYGYTSGYYPTQFNKLDWSGKYSGSHEFENAVFKQITAADTIDVLFKSSLLPDSELIHSEATIDYGFILLGNISAGSFWLYDLYYSELLHQAKFEYTDRTKVLCVYPWEKKESVHYRIVAIEVGEAGQYEISYTYLNYTNPLKPHIEKSGKAVITKEKFLRELEYQLTATNAVDVQSQCASPGLPRLVALPEKRFFYSLPCLDQHGRERADEPMDLSLYVEKLFYKYLYEK
jgi:hypothetical protein